MQIGWGVALTGRPPLHYNGGTMDANRISKMADKIVDAFADMRVTDDEMMYVAMYTVIRAHPRQILERVVEYGEQVKWEIRNERRNNDWIQDELFG